MRKPPAQGNSLRQNTGTPLKENSIQKIFRQRVTILSELGKAALRGESISVLMDKIVAELAETLGVEFCKVLEFQPDENLLLLRAGVGWREGLVGKELVPAGKDSQAGFTLLSNDPVVVVNFDCETRFVKPQLLQEHGVVSGVSVIIQGVSGPWGILGAHSVRRCQFSQDDVSFVQSVSNILAEAIERKIFIDNLRQSEKKFRGLVETAPDGVVISNAEGKIEIVNKQIESMTGYDNEELVGRAIEILVPPRYRKHGLYRKEYMQDPHTRSMGERGSDLFLRRKDGSEFPVEISLAPLETDSGVIISSVIRDITERKNAELKNLQSQKRLRNLTQRLQAAREEERTAVARDIHDELGQMLTGLKMDLFWLSERLPEHTEDLQYRARTMITLIESTINSVRRLSTSLRPAILDDLGLAAAIEWQVQGFAGRTGCRYSLKLDHSDFAMDKERDTSIFRIFQEALTNIARHADAQKVDISLRRTGKRLVLTVKDNGKGMDQKKLTDTLSLGLMGMQERAGAIGGDLEIKSLSGKGTKVTLKVPIGE